LCVYFARLAGLCAASKRGSFALTPKLAVELILTHECACQAFYLERVAEFFLGYLSLVPASFAGLFRRAAGFFCFP